MGNCCSRRWCFTEKPKKKIVLLAVGLDNSGKTAIVKGLSGESRDYLMSTNGFSLAHLKYRKCDIHIYDLGGGPQIRGIWHLYFADAHGIIFVVDASDYERLIETKEVLHELLMNEKLAGKPMLLLANKQDIYGALDELDVVEKLGVEELVNRQRCPTLVKSCSATEMERRNKLDQSITQGYTWLLNLILREYWKINARVQRDLREQVVKNTRTRKQILERVRKAESRRSTPNSIEWLNGSGDGATTLITADETHKQIETISSDDSGLIFTEGNGDNISVPSPEVPALSPIVPFENHIVKEVQPKRRSFLPEFRSNKTAPASLLGIDSLKDLSPVSDKISDGRRLKSAQARLPLTLNATALLHFNENSSNF